MLVDTTEHKVGITRKTYWKHAGLWLLVSFVFGFFGGYYDYPEMIPMGTTIVSLGLIWSSSLRCIDIGCSRLWAIFGAVIFGTIVFGSLRSRTPTIIQVLHEQ